MTPPNASEPNDIESLRRLLVAERAARFEAEAKAALATAQMSGAEAVIAHLKLAIEKMRRELYGSRSERGHKLLDQMEFELEDLEATAAEDEAAAEIAAMRAGLSTLIPAHRRRSGRRPFPDHLPREKPEAEADPSRRRARRSYEPPPCPSQGRSDEADLQARKRDHAEEIVAAAVHDDAEVTVGNHGRNPKDPGFGGAFLIFKRRARRADASR